MSELTHMEQHFPFSRRVLGKVEERMSALETAMQRAKQVHQFPSLESYCYLDSVCAHMHTLAHTHTQTRMHTHTHICTHAQI